MDDDFVAFEQLIIPLEEPIDEIVIYRNELASAKVHYWGDYKYGFVTDLYTRKNRGSGYGSHIMDGITQFADVDGTMLFLKAIPYGPGKSKDPTRLINFYKRWGFTLIPYTGYFMIRKNNKC